MSRNWPRLAAEEDAAAKVFAYLRDGINDLVGNKLMTASIYDLANMRSRRVFSEDFDAYPVGNFKRLDRNLYFDTVIAGKQIYSSTRIEQIADVFFDWQKIQDLGFESNLNLPAIANGEVIGTVNLLNKKGHYTPERVELARAWQPVATLAFLLLHMQDTETATFHAGLSIDSPKDMEGAA
ncbi:GAF domain-containing protein [uncultured Cohaesibacter sp.]|uniref:GAF domain-containing protein n=1 Tax=uncultured Cohaesibacter sp. TaxID=1002546 RepID=UPI0029C67B08|nr:GAF domain-containing protein [uncultured Cohaesibacter sp.]